MESFNYSLGCLLFTLVNYKINHRVYHESIPKTLAMNFGIITGIFCSDPGFIWPSLLQSLVEKIDPGSCPCKNTFQGALLHVPHCEWNLFNLISSVDLSSWYIQLKYSILCILVSNLGVMFQVLDCKMTVSQWTSGFQVFKIIFPHYGHLIF